MHIPALALFLSVLACVARQTPATSIRQVLGRRQLGGIGPVASVPSECNSTCAPVNDEINLGCPLTACCTTTFENQYYNCLDCVGTADATNFTAAQNSLNLLYTTCVDLGYVLPPLALPGQSASNSNSSTGTSTSNPTSGASTSRRWRSGQPEVLIGATMLLWLAELW